MRIWTASGKVPEGRTHSCVSVVEILRAAHVLKVLIWINEFAVQPTTGTVAKVLSIWYLCACWLASFSVSCSLVR